MRKILLLDDDLNVLKSIRRCFHKKPWQVDIFTSASEAIGSIAGNEYNLIVSDYMMPEMNGIQFMESIKNMQPDALRMMLSGSQELAVVVDAINRANVHRFIMKPWNDLDLLFTFEKALEYHDIVSENRLLLEQLKMKQQQLSAQRTELERLEQESPGITQVKWNEDGSIELPVD